MTKYAIISDEGEYFSLKLGRDVPGLPSHGAAVEAGRFNTVAEAKAYAIAQHDISAERIYAQD